jgi:hypothetical protein
MKFIPVLVVACFVSQAAFAEGLECHRVLDPTPHLSCVEKPATADAQRPDEVSPSDSSRRQPGSDRNNNDGVTSRTTKICRNC